MDSLDNEINSLLYYYVKRDNLVVMHAANSDCTGVLAAGNESNKKNKNKTKQFWWRLKRKLSSSLKLTGARRKQEQSPFTMTTAHRFRKLSTGTNSNSRTYAPLSADNNITSSMIHVQDVQALENGKESIRSIAKPGTKKHIQQIIKNLFMGKRRHGRHKTYSSKTSGLNLDKHIDINQEVHSNNNTNTELVEPEYAPDVQPTTSRNLGTKTRKRITYFFKSLFKKKRIKDNQTIDLINYMGVDDDFLEKTSTIYIKAYGSSVSSGSEVKESSNEASNHLDLEDIEPMKNRNEEIVSESASETKKYIPNFLKSLLKRKSGTPSVSNYNNEVLIQQSVTKGSTAIDTSLDLVEDSKPQNLGADLGIDKAIEVPKCDCEMRRFDLMVDSLNLIILRKNQTLKKEKIKELQQIDPITCHFNNCFVTVLTAKQTELPTQIRCPRSQSSVSLYSFNWCLQCQEPDEHFDEDVVENLLPLMSQIENEDDLSIPQKTIEYFLHACCYDHFKKGILKVIGSQCTPRNVARLHYLVRRIVKHIGDPNIEDNKTIQNILKHAKRFNLHYYQPHIKATYQTLTNFLLSGLENDEVG